MWLKSYEHFHQLTSHGDYNADPSVVQSQTCITIDSFHLSELTPSILVTDVREPPNIS